MYVLNTVLTGNKHDNQSIEDTQRLHKHARRGY